jgi:hypothetical protein
MTSPDPLIHEATSTSTPTQRLEQLGSQNLELALHVLANPNLSAEGLEGLLSALLPDAPKPAHALAAASNPALTLLFLAEPTTAEVISSLILQLSDAARNGALAIVEQLPWEHRHLLLAPYNAAHVHEIMEEVSGSKRSTLSTSRYRPWLGPSDTRSPGLHDNDALEQLERKDEPEPKDGINFRLTDPRFMVAEYILERALEYGTRDALQLGIDLFERLAPAGVRPPSLWLTLIKNLG